MDVDRTVRWAALAAIPVVAGVLGLAQTRKPGSAADQELTPASTTSEPRGLGPLASALAERGEAALARPAATAPAPSTPAGDTEEPSPAPPIAARDLPLAVLPTGHRETTTAPRAARSPGSFGTCGGIEAKLITASDDPTWAFASLSPALGEPAVVRKIGETIGGFRVEQIEWDRVWLRAGGGRCAVGLHAGVRELAEGARPKGRRGAPLDAPTAAERWRVPGEIANAIDKETETRFKVDPELVSAIYDRAGDLLAGVRVEPVRKDDEVVGFALEDVRVDSLLERLGVESGDVVLSIAGERCATLDAVGRALATARDRAELVAQLERHGEAFELRVVAR